MVKNVKTQFLRTCCKLYWGREHLVLCDKSFVISCRHCNVLSLNLLIVRIFVEIKSTEFAARDQNFFFLHVSLDISGGQPSSLVSSPNWQHK